jgi:hypothetical protein
MMVRRRGEGRFFYSYACLGQEDQPTGYTRCAWRDGDVWLAPVSFLEVTTAEQARKKAQSQSKAKGKARCQAPLLRVSFGGAEGAAEISLAPVATSFVPHPAHRACHAQARKPVGTDDDDWDPEAAGVAGKRAGATIE